jgi:hypothetical protein
MNMKYRNCLDPRLNKVGKVGFVASLALAISTATMSDGGDMNWTLHTIGATSFFILTLVNCLTVSNVYKSLWK